MTVLPAGDAYAGEVNLSDADTYTFWEPGVLGEKIPLQTTNVSVSGDCGENCSFSWQDRNTIAFSEGNVSIRYEAPIRQKNLQLLFEEPSSITINLPGEFDVSNPLLGRVSDGGEIAEENGTTIIHYEDTRFAEVRFYDPGQERLLLIFGSIWLTVAVVLLVPYLLMRRRQG
ncbi:hypothetical protein CUJ86_09335 [Methanofollis fontis]|uniref:Uncharacterized protein n=1 Tax=Methanofollis fontis TaxID=2052832 RepID=A0A483CSX7_9EURY|nr:hypothetical protein CUJ86_09335 [Methanofollis fontis]